ncbi:phosphoribosylanthranilate isomerase [Gracilimonas mengyeensis]|uniref:N-(5'-phosphoribosyl)anthranilate isomerase n=1 Tax=Gracilimonas mengyeensis TaxID=1302730 RepID=A0A521AH51_9BACT|nr:phosphoribosylanthranilate isomerase [Gracilimonas mengyeensis]SMO34068.1 phosphoribosylanthranilate isomerase [Gracilimonas mengyeensis]
MKIKICGITNLEDARFAAGALVDYLGFIFYDKSPRYIEPGEAGAIINWIEGPEKVGVFVNQPLDDVNRIAKETGLDYVQLHGDESPEYCSLVEKSVIKVIHIEEESVEYLLKHQIEQYAEVADYLLFDTKINGLWGGTGKSFDWSMITDLDIEIPFFLSGGLSADNIKEAIETVQPFAIDVSSSLEKEPGLKDFGKIEDFMDEIRDLELE